MESTRPARPTYGGRKQTKRRKKSTGSLDDLHMRSVSEGGSRRPKQRNVSRDSSTASSVMSLDVRCACQYYQSNSPLPEKINPVGLPHIVIRRWYVPPASTLRVFINRRDGDVTSFGRTWSQFFGNYWRLERWRSAKRQCGRRLQIAGDNPNWWCGPKFVCSNR